MYEARIVKFLREHPNLTVTPFDLARLWRRDQQLVVNSAINLALNGFIKFQPKGVLSLAG